MFTYYHKYLVLSTFYKLQNSINYGKHNVQLCNTWSQTLSQIRGCLRTVYLGQSTLGYR